MITRQFNRKARQFDFFINGTYVRSADVTEAAAVEAELTAKLLKAAELHG